MNPVIRTLLAFGSSGVAAAITLSYIGTPESPVGVPAASVDHPRPTSTEAPGDSAIAIEDGHLPAHAAVGRFTGTMVCTAAVVLHPRIIITAAHCIAKRDESGSLTKPTFRPARGVGSSVDRFEATVWAVGSRQLATAQSARDASNDWAILVLDRAPANTRPLHVRGLSAEELIRLPQQILMPAYAVDAAGSLSLRLDPSCSVSALMWNVLLHDCKASAGASGAPLLIHDGQWYALVGIHTGSMFAVDEHGHIAGSIGNSANGATSFIDALAALSRRLQSDGAYDAAHHGH
jgi:V8-like Glu-specific endopeptidase